MGRPSSWLRGWRRLAWRRWGCTHGRPVNTTEGLPIIRSPKQWCELCGVPVIASGDVVSVSAARTILDSTGAAAVMVARGAAGDPWLVDSLLAGESRPRPPLPEVVADLRALLALVIDEMGERRAAKWMWRLVGWYLRPSRVPTAADRGVTTGARRPGTGCGPRGPGDQSAAVAAASVDKYVPTPYNAALALKGC